MTETYNGPPYRQQLEIPCITELGAWMRQGLGPQQVFTTCRRYILGSDLVDNPQEIYLSSRDLAKYLGVSEQSLATYKRRGILPQPVKGFGDEQTCLYRLSDIDAILAKHIPTLAVDCPTAYEALTGKREKSWGASRGSHYKPEGSHKVEVSRKDRANCADKPGASHDSV